VQVTHAFGRGLGDEVPAEIEVNGRDEIGRWVLEAVAEDPVVRGLAAGREAGIELDKQPAAAVLDRGALIAVGADHRAAAVGVL
jgi:hypothetical protein